MKRSGTQTLRDTLLVPGRDAYAIGREHGVRHASVTAFLDGNDAALSASEKE
jgi:hypothetical protein